MADDASHEPYITYKEFQEEIAKFKRFTTAQSAKSIVVYYNFDDPEKADRNSVREKIFEISTRNVCDILAPFGGRLIQFGESISEYHEVARLALQLSRTPKKFREGGE